MTSGMYTSNSSEWETPIDLFNRLNMKWHFALDVCATKENAKCEKYFDRDTNGLKQKWTGVCWMNPPYGREIGYWVEKAYNTAQRSEWTVVGLLPARTDTSWFHCFILYKAEIEFLRGRLHFSNSANAAPFPSMIVTWHKKIGG